MSVQNILNSLSLKEQLLQLMMMDIRYFEIKGKLKPVTHLPKELVEFFTQYSFGGTILFAENVVSHNETQILIKQLQTNSRLPQFIALDEEGGVVSRLMDSIATPGNMALGAINDITVTESVATIIGTELSKRGVNLNFAPVVDINSNPLNPVIGVRSFGSDKHLVTRHAKAFASGLKSSGVISCLKHFPGHGDTITDTHHTLSIVDKSDGEMMDNELYPYHELIKSNTVDMIMTAHLVVPQIDKNKLFATKVGALVDTPATFSRQILTHILRDKLAYTGIIVSDALDMGAIHDNFTQLEASIYALEAGVDILLMPFRIWNKYQLRDFTQYFELLYTHIENSAFLKERVKQSCRLVLELKQRYLINKASEININDDADYIEQIARRGVTLFNNQTLPWMINSQHKVLSIASNDLILGEVQNITKNIGYKSDTLNYTLNLDKIMTEINKYTHVILYSYNLTQADAALQQIINQLNQLNKPYVLVITRNPYDILYLDNVATSIMIYGVSGFDQTNYQIKRFNLNLKVALELIYMANSLDEFNSFCPVKV